MDVSQHFELFEQQIKPFKKLLGKAADSIMDENVSSYPIFVFHKGAAEIGIPLLDENVTAAGWLINASTMEEFVARQIIESEKLDDFKNVYKNPKEHICVFLIEEIGATFAFMPRS